MSEVEKTACVTGANGMIGRRITDRLTGAGLHVRVLSRSDRNWGPDIEVCRGDLSDADCLRRFLNGAHFIFHCAAELHNVAEMQEVNVAGTRRLLRASAESGAEYFCHISSAGVIGKTEQKWVDETTICDPQNEYEKSKWKAEKLVAAGIGDCRVVILRPTNVVDESRAGIFDLFKNRNLPNRLKLFLKGGECARIVHAEDVADAALHFVDKPITGPEIYFVSRDEEDKNTFAGLWKLYHSAQNNLPPGRLPRVFHLPIFVPDILRKIWRGDRIRGDVRFSSAKIKATGFRYSRTLPEIVERFL